MRKRGFLSVMMCCVVGCAASNEKLQWAESGPAKPAPTAETAQASPLLIERVTSLKDTARRCFDAYTMYGFTPLAVHLQMRWSWRLADAEGKLARLSRDPQGEREAAERNVKRLGDRVRSLQSRAKAGYDVISA